MINTRWLLVFIEISAAGLGRRGSQIIIRRGHSGGLVGVESQHHGHTGGGDLTDLRHYRVHQAGRGQVVHQIEETERVLILPVRQVSLSLPPSLHNVLRVQQLIVDEAVRLNSLCKLVSFAAENDRLVAAFRQQSDLYRGRQNKECLISEALT